MKKKLLVICLCVCMMLATTACEVKENKVDAKKEQAPQANEVLAQKYNATEIVLSDEEILVDGNAVSENEEAAVYTANDIVFYLRTGFYLWRRVKGG